MGKSDKMKFATFFAAAAVANAMDLAKFTENSDAAEYDGGQVVKCFIQFGKDVEACENYLETAPECQEDGPDFDPRKCSRSFTTCFLRAFGSVPTCIAGQQ